MITIIGFGIGVIIGVAAFYGILILIDIIKEKLKK